MTIVHENIVARLNTGLIDGPLGSLEIKRDIGPISLERKLGNGLRVIRPRVFVTLNDKGETVLRVEGLVPFERRDNEKGIKDLAEKTAKNLELKLDYEIEVR